MTVVVVGDANPDLVLRGDIVPRFGQSEQLLDSAELTIGGSAAITAHAFARLGRPGQAVRLVAAVGADLFGEQITARVAEAGVDVSGVLVREDVPTGLTVVLSAAGDRAILTLPGAIASLTADDVRRALQAVAGPHHIHLAALFLQPALLDGLAPVLAQARTRGATISLDTNDDPAGSWHGVAELLPHVDVLLPNRTEALHLARTACGAATANLDDAAATLAEAGPLVVVKDGAAGALARGRDIVVAAPGLPAEVVDTTGAGDTFDAAFLDAWLAGAPVPHALRRAVLAGACAVGAVGGTGGQPTAARLDADLAAETPAELSV